MGKAENLREDGAGGKKESETRQLETEVERSKSDSATGQTDRVGGLWEEQTNRETVRGEGRVRRERRE